jgi:hypothetical protein
MKHSIIIFFLANYICTPCYSQDNSSRILEIKKMYGEVIKLSNSNISKQCKKGKMTNYEGFDSRSEKMPFEQTAELCHISKDYITYDAKFCGYEWGSNVIYYLKNNKIFFVFISSGGEACINEYRVYYDLNENIIKILKKSNDCDGNSPLNSSEIKEKTEIKNIYDDIHSNFNKVLKMIK